MTKTGHLSDLILEFQKIFFDFEHTTLDPDVYGLLCNPFGISYFSNRPSKYNMSNNPFCLVVGDATKRLLKKVILFLFFVLIFCRRRIAIRCKSSKAGMI